MLAIPLGLQTGWTADAFRSVVTPSIGEFFYREIFVGAPKPKSPVKNPRIHFKFPLNY